MNDLTLFQFEKTEIRTITNERGEPWFVLRDVLEAMQSTTKRADAIDAITQGLGDGMVNDLPILDKLGRPQTATIISEPAVTFLVSRSNTETGRKLNRFIHAEVLPQIRKTGRYEAPNTTAVAPLDKKLVIGRAAVDWLRMSDTSKLRLLADISKSEGVDPSFLPSYVDEPLTRSMTALLIEHGKPFSIHVANAALTDMGLLETLTRPSSKGEPAKFKSLTAAGLEYGRNETSPQSPRETQPLYFVHRFPELLDRINAHRAAHQGDSNVTPIRPETA